MSSATVCLRYLLVTTKYLYIVDYSIVYIRCDIPVVIMGETGCGKTRLIRYMCNLARQKKDANNMLIMKVSTIFKKKLINVRR